MQKIKEILTYEIYTVKDSIYVHVPVQNLINPKFLLKNNQLYIFLYNYTMGYMLDKLPLNLIDAIKKNKCLLCEAINSKEKQHQINLEP
jgi:hypothetical protein